MVSVVAGLVTALTYAAVALDGLSAEVRGLVGLDQVARVDDPGAHYSFLQTQPGSTTPVGWNPCEPIRVVVDPADAPDEWRDLVDEAVAAVSRASGLRFEDLGTTEDRRFTGRQARGPDPDPVLIGWADEDEVEELAGDVAGIGGAVAVGDGRGWWFGTGSMALDTEAFDRLEGARDGHDVELGIVLHELGHVVGLAHVDDRGELMHRDGVPRPTFGPGDVEGLTELGALRCR